MNQRIGLAGAALLLVAVVAALGLIALAGNAAPRVPLTLPPVVMIVTATPPENTGWLGELLEATVIPPTPTPTPTALLLETQPRIPPVDLPPSGTPPPTHPSGCRTYTAKAGDGLANIADVFGVPLIDLLRANGLEGASGVEAGRVLIIPIGGCGVPPPATATRRPTRVPTQSVPEGVPPTAVAAVPEAPVVPPLSQDFRVTIPSLNIDLAVTQARFTGTTWDFTPITYKAAHLEGLALPGVGGNVVIGAHSELTRRRPGPFFTLYKISPGDEIFVNYGGAQYRYVVERTWIVVPTDIGPIDQGAGDVLTLLTCDGYNSRTDEYDTRLIVRAVRAN